MSRIGYILLVLRALWELARYDMVHAALGFRSIYEYVERQRVASCIAGTETERLVCDAVSIAVCLYWKRVYCLQRSAVAAKLLRQSGIPSRLVIGYRPSPFFSHAWVEVNGRVVNDSPVYKERLHVLCSF